MRFLSFHHQRLTSSKKKAEGRIPNPAATDLETQLRLLPTVVALLSRAKGRAQAHQRNSPWRATHAYWREWLAARIEQLRSFAPPEYDDSLLSADPPADALLAPPTAAFGCLPSASLQALCERWLCDVDEAERAACVAQLVDFVQSNRDMTLERPPAPPAQASEALRLLLGSVCMHVRRKLADCTYDGDLWAVVESKLRGQIGRRLFGQLRASLETDGTDASPRDDNTESEEHCERVDVASQLGGAKPRPCDLPLT